jgi:hypothetical protein
MTLAMIQKIFQNGRELEDEILSMTAVTLIIAIVENLGEGLQPYIHTIN